MLLSIIVVAMATAADIFTDIAPALGVIVPPLVAWASKHHAPAGVKRAVTFIVCAGVSIASLAMQDWTGITFADIVERFFVVVGESQVLYWTVDAWLRGALERPGGIGSLKVFRPDAGIG